MFPRNEHVFQQTFLYSYIWGHLVGLVLVRLHVSVQFGRRHVALPLSTRYQRYFIAVRIRADMRLCVRVNAQFVHAQVRLPHERAVAAVYVAFKPFVVLW